jgi:hypothetical protein
MFNPSNAVGTTTCRPECGRTAGGTVHIKSKGENNKRLADIRDEEPAEMPHTSVSSAVDA